MARRSDSGQGIAFRQQAGQLDIAVTQLGKHVRQLLEIFHAFGQRLAAQFGNAVERREVLGFIEAVLARLCPEQFGDSGNSP